MTSISKVLQVSLVGASLALGCHMGNRATKPVGAGEEAMPPLEGSEADLSSPSTRAPGLKVAFPGGGEAPHGAGDPGTGPVPATSSGGADGGAGSPEKPSIDE